MPRQTTTELLNGPDGQPYRFVCRDDELRQALAAVPDKVILDAYRRAWKGSRLKPPRRTANGLRRRILAHHKRASRPPSKPRRVPVLEAARLLGIPSRTLRREIERGERPALYIGTGRRNGTLAIEVPPLQLPRPHVLIPQHERPDPRIVALRSRA